MRFQFEWLGVVALSVLGACSTLVGADFDDLTTAAPGNASGGDQSGNSAGNDNEGGADAAAGSGGSSSGGTHGGSAGKGGNAGKGGGAGKGGAGGSGGAAGGGAGGSAGESGSGGTAGNGGGEGGDGGEGTDTGVIVLNEVMGHGADTSDYIELYNQGPGTVDIAGYRIVDAANNSYEFPDSTLVPEGGYVLLELVDLGSGLPLGGPLQCWTEQFICFRDEDWGIAQGGELVRLRDAGGTIIDSTQYPGEPELDEDQSWGRLPNGNGTFQATATTPELENTAP